MARQLNCLSHYFHIVFCTDYSTTILAFSLVTSAHLLCLLTYLFLYVTFLYIYNCPVIHHWVWYLESNCCQRVSENCVLPTAKLELKTLQCHLAMASLCVWSSFHTYIAAAVFISSCSEAAGTYLLWVLQCLRFIIKALWTILTIQMCPWTGPYLA